MDASPEPIFVRGIACLTYSIDKLTTGLGRALSWLTAIMVVTVVAVVLLRAVFNFGSIGIQESVAYMHATVFLLCMAYTAKANGHVRVDILYRKATLVQKAWVNAVGSILFMLPFALFLTFISWDMVGRSWELQEISTNPGGLPLVFVLKSLIPLCGILMALHSLSEILQNLITLCFKGISTTTNQENTPKEQQQGVSA